MSSSSDSTTDHTRHRTHARCRGSRGSNWSAFNVATMVVGFMIYWPLGLFVLLWICVGRDVQDLPASIRRLCDGIARAWEGQGRPATGGTSKNVVFDEFQQAQYERIREIRDEIKERARRFADFRARARRRADEEEFNQFMSDAPARGDG